MQNNQEHEAGNFNTDELSTIFNLGITRTLWKSNMLSKINDLRTALHLSPRTEELSRETYDKEVTDILSEIDFSPLGTSSNAQAWIMLHCAGRGLIPAPEVEPSTSDVAVLGSDNYSHYDGSDI